MKEKSFGAMTDADWESEVSNSKAPVFVEFWAPWCGPCQTMTPIFQSISQEYQQGVKFVRVNVDESPELTSRLGIFSVPTIMIFKDGKQVYRFVGIATRAQLSSKLKSFTD